MKIKILFLLVLSAISLQSYAGQGQSTLAGAATGAITGAMTGNPLGIVIGGLVGAIGGVSTRNYIATQKYGNWCGENNTHSRSSGVPAIDALDNACKTHDLCLNQYPGNRSLCHNNLIAAAKHLMNASYLSSEARSYASRIYSIRQLLLLA